MKKELFAAILLAVILLLSMINTQVLEALANDMAEYVLSAKECANLEQWREAEENILKSVAVLYNNEMYFHIILHHSEINELNDNFFDLLEAVYRKDIPSVKAMSELVVSNLDSIVTSERLNIGSIL